jgi:hypothetical protein
MAELVIGNGTLASGTVRSAALDAVAGVGAGG